VPASAAPRAAAASPGTRGSAQARVLVPAAVPPAAAQAAAGELPRQIKCWSPCILDGACSADAACGKKWNTPGAGSGSSAGTTGGGGGSAALGPASFCKQWSGHGHENENCTAGWPTLWANFRALIGIFSQSVGPSLAIWANPVQFSLNCSPARGWSDGRPTWHISTNWNTSPRDCIASANGEATGAAGASFLPFYSLFYFIFISVGIATGARKITV
jgi:hypothetical protein